MMDDARSARNMIGKFAEDEHKTDRAHLKLIYTTKKARLINAIKRRLDESDNHSQLNPASSPKPPRNSSR
jgi:hypothetical protein